MFLNQDNVLRVAPNALKIDDNDFNIQLIMETLDALVSALVATELNYVKSNTLAFKQELKEVIIDIVNNRPTNVENAITQCEQLSLRIACFPDNDPDKRIGLMAAEFAKKLCEPGHICVVLSLNLSRFCWCNVSWWLHQLVLFLYVIISTGRSDIAASTDGAGNSSLRLVDTAKELQSLLGLKDFCNDDTIGEIWMFYDISGSGCEAAAFQSKVTNRLDEVKTRYATLLGKEDRLGIQDSFTNHKPFFLQSTFDILYYTTILYVSSFKF